MSRIKTVKVEADNKHGFMIINESDVTHDHVLCKGEVMGVPLEVLGNVESVSGIQKELDDVYSGIADLESELADAKTDLAKSEIELSSAKEDLVEAQSALAKYGGLIAELNAELDALRASKNDAAEKVGDGKGKAEKDADKKPAKASSDTKASNRQQL